MKATLLIPAMLLIVVAATSATERAPAAPPDGLSASDWSSIRAAYDAGRHKFLKQADSTHVARNHALGWRIEFDGKGFTATPDGGGWQWGLELVEEEAPGLNAQAPPTPSHHLALGPWSLNIPWSLSHRDLDLSRSSAMEAKDNRLSIRRTELDEWFINDGRGLEQGWTFKRRPLSAGGKGALRVDLKVRGGLIARANEAGDSVSFREASGATVLTYGGLKAWDADGKVLPARMTSTAQGDGIAVEVRDEGARYPVTIDPIAQQAYMKASNTDANDNFGISVAVSGDTVVVGADDEQSIATGVNGNQADVSGTGCGAAYVFVRTGATWTQQAYLKASNNEGQDDNFGISVAISANTIVVGAFREDSNATGVNAPLTGGSGSQTDDSATNSGAAYVFVRTGSTWTQQAYLKASNPDAQDDFGLSVGVSGNTIVVGARREDSNETGVNGNQADNSASSAGAAYVFVRTGTTWSQQAYLKASNTDAQDEFGRSVAIFGDSVIVGAHQEDSNATVINAPPTGGSGTQADDSAGSSGAAYVFVRTGTTWAQHAYLKPNNTDASDLFGGSVAISADTAVVGATGEDSNATGVNGDPNDDSAGIAGAAYVFVRTGPTWVQQAYLKASNTEAGDQFGISVALSGDVAVVAASDEDSGSVGVNGDEANNDDSGAGAAYVFVRTGSQWGQQAYLKASNSDPNDSFGTAVAVSGGTVVVGAELEASNAIGVNAPLAPGSGTQADDSKFSAGAAYIFSGFGVVLPTLSRTTAPAPGGADIFFAAPGFPAINAVGKVMFDQALTGTGSTNGRNRGIFALTGVDGVELAFLNGTSLAGVGGFALGSKALALGPPIMNRDDFGLFLATATGTGVTTSNNKLLLKDDGVFISMVRRTGQDVVELGNAKPNTFKEVLQNPSASVIAVCHTLLQSTAPTPDVTAANDSGVLALDPNGVFLDSTLPNTTREGDVAFGVEAGTFGQFTGRAAYGPGARIHFGAVFKPADSTPAVQALFFTDATGSTLGRTVKVGQVPLGVAFNETIASLPAFSQQGNATLFRATLGKSLPATNQGIWRGTLLLTRKGDEVDPGNLPGVVISAITKFWPVGNDQLVLLVTLSGPGVTAANNKALLLRQSDNQYIVLLRTGSRAPGAGPATVLAIQTVDVDPILGHYVVVGSLAGAATTNNQVLWAGRTSAGLNSTAHLRLPTLRLRKGDRFISDKTPLGTIKSLTLKPAVDTTGAGGRGLAQVVGAGGQAAVYILTDSGALELVLLTL